MRTLLVFLLCLALVAGGCSLFTGSGADSDPSQKPAETVLQQKADKSGSKTADAQSTPQATTQATTPTQSGTSDKAAASNGASSQKQAAPLCGPEAPASTPPPKKPADDGKTQEADGTWQDPKMPDKTDTTSPYHDSVPGNAPAPKGDSTGKKDGETTKDANQNGGTAAQNGAQDGQQPSKEKDGLAPEDKGSYRSAFSLYPTRNYRMLRGVLKTVKKQTDLENLVVQAQTCDFLTSQKQGDLDAFKKKLLDKARADAAYLLFSRFYSGQTQLGRQGQLPLEYQEAVADRVQFKSSPQYYNGDVFGELCVKVSATIPPETMDAVSPVEASLENFCLQQDGLDESTLMQKTTSAALDRIIQNIAPGSVPPDDFRQALLNQATTSGKLGGPGNNTYCLDMQVEISPLELGVYVPKAVKSKDEQKTLPDTLTSRGKPSFFLDLSQYSPGDVLSQYGDNLAVYKDVNGKSLGSISKDQALAVIPVTSGQDFNLRVLVQKESQYDFLYSEKVELFRIHFANKAWEQAVFVMSLDDDNNPVAQLRTRTSSSDTFPWTNAANFNDCYLVKQGGQMKFFFNGIFVMTYPTKGDTLTQVRVPLKWGERLYNVIVESGK